MKVYFSAFILLSACLSGIPLNNSAAGKLRIKTTRILYEVLADPVYSLNEPGSAYMSLIVQSCNVLLDELNRQKPRSFRVNILTNRLIRNIDRLKNLKYELNRAGRNQSENIIKQYYSLDEF